MPKPILHHFVVQTAIDSNIYVSIPDHWIRDDTRNMLRYAKDRLIDLGVYDWPKVELRPSYLKVTAEGTPKDDWAIRSIQAFLHNLLNHILSEAQASD